MNTYSLVSMCVGQEGQVAVCMWWIMYFARCVYVCACGVCLCVCVTVRVQLVHRQVKVPDVKVNSE